VLHGGPGSGCTGAMRRFADPAVWDIVLFDQRGAGRSQPLGALADNTTGHLLDDLERLQGHLGIQRWAVLGFSWGCTLGLAHAERNPARVTGLVLEGVGTTRRSEIEWLYRGVAALVPEAWHRFASYVGGGQRGVDLLESYERRFADPDPAVRDAASEAFSAYELALSTVDAEAQLSGRWLDPAWRLARARIVTHYFVHGAWLEEGALLDRAGELAGTPGILLQGRFDIGSPMLTAWELTQVWPEAELRVVDTAGHSPADPGMPEALTAAVAELGQRVNGS
jgi:proline iminopeptidase